MRLALKIQSTLLLYLIPCTQFGLLVKFVTIFTILAKYIAFGKLRACAIIQTEREFVVETSSSVVLIEQNVLS